MAGQSRNLFARLSNDTAALTTLSVTATAITLTRAGSAPQFSRVVFEQSVDNGATWTLLGPAAKGFAFLAYDDESYSKNARHGAVYSFGGQDLPVEQNILIRARGFYTTGYLCGSEAIEDVMQNAFLLAPLQLTSALSRKTHGSAGDFGIALPLAGEPGVECRWSGGAHMLIFTFSNNVVRGDASVTTGNGSVSGSPTFAGNSMTVNLTGVTDVQRITVTLSGVTDSLGQVLPDAAMSVNMLIGDTNGDRTVNAGDALQTRSRSGQSTDATNFRNDVNIDGMVNSGDSLSVRSRSGSFLP
jgi:hypothetical protein